MGKTLGLALGAGGLRGLAHIGVLQILEENAIPVSYISGTSSGSIIAALYATGMSPYQMENVVLNLEPEDYLDYNYSGLIKYLLAFIIPGINKSFSGVVKGNKIEGIIKKLTKGKNIKQAKMPLAIIGCDINSGKEVIFSNYNMVIKDPHITLIQDVQICEAVRASIAIPATFVPKTIGEMQLVDGAVREVVPVTPQKCMGADYILAVNLSKDRFDHPANGLFEIVARSISVLTAETSDFAEKIFADMVLYPDVLDVDLDDIKQAIDVIKAGRIVMKQKLPELKTQLGLN